MPARVTYETCRRRRGQLCGMCMRDLHRRLIGGEVEIAAAEWHIGINPTLADVGGCR